ncbi:MAG: cyclase family protein [Thermoleophilaceae bacterium]
MSSADEIGRLAWMTPESQAAALAAADPSRAFDLAVDYFLGMPSWTVLGDPEYDIWLTHTPEAEGHEYSGTAISMYTHVGTHICSLNHLGHDGRFWSGWTAQEHLGSRAWRVGGRYPPIIARGVLLDVAGAHGVDCLPDSYAITPDDLSAAGASELRRGDVALVRTGRMSRWPDHDAFMNDPPGVGMAAARMLAEELEVICIGVDCGGEPLPAELPGTFLPVHSYLLADMGVPVMENVWLEDIAQAGVRDFTLLAFPLKLAGSTGLPVRPVALAAA